jgi:hypothetical protein
MIAFPASFIVSRRFKRLVEAEWLPVANAASDHQVGKASNILRPSRA